MLSARLQRRLRRHHLPLAGVMLAFGWLLYITRDYSDVITRLSFASAWLALALLALTLAIGPWRTLRGKAPAVSLDLRRDIGIWAGMVGLFHAVVGQCVHLRGRPWLYYIYEKWRAMPLRYDMFGFSNYTGLAAAILLAVLLATSNDFYLRRLGNRKWKTLQRWSYWGAGFASLHTFGYLLGIETAKPGYMILAVLVIAATAILQVMGWRRRV
jgi:sulfoxide reductase heme-binding subunit YedZ